MNDHLGSSRLLTDASGNVVWQSTFLPYGYEYSPQGSVNNYKFTGFERDSESGLDHAWFRQYAPHMGRWMSPDPAGLAAVDPTNPQTWNRYAYVAGNPANAVDPSGLLNCPAMDDDGKCYYTGDFAKGAGPPLDPWFWQEGFGMASASQMMAIWGYGSSTSGCFGPVCFGGDTLPGQLGTIQNVLTGNWGAFFPAIPGYNAPGIFDAEPTTQHQLDQKKQQMQGCIKNAKQVRNAALRETYAETAIGAAGILLAVGTSGESMALMGGMHGLMNLSHLLPHNAPGFVLYANGLYRTTEAYNAYDRAVAQCQADAGYPE